MNIYGFKRVGEHTGVKSPLFIKLDLPMGCQALTLPAHLCLLLPFVPACTYSCLCVHLYQYHPLWAHNRHYFCEVIETRSSNPMFQVKLHVPFNMRWLIAGKWTQRVQVDTKGTSGCKRLGLLPLVLVISNQSFL